MTATNMCSNLVVNGIVPTSVSIYREEGGLYCYTHSHTHNMPAINSVSIYREGDYTAIPTVTSITCSY